jgi:hypothetical protein
MKDTPYKSPQLEGTADLLLTNSRLPADGGNTGIPKALETGSSRAAKPLTEGRSSCHAG